MAKDFTICVGTVGAGVWYSSNGGDNWRRSKMKLPFDDEPGEIQIRALAVSPHNPNQLYAGSEAGLYRSDDRGASWNYIESPMYGKQIWSVAVSPDDPNEVWAGTKPPAVYRTKDGGQTWEQAAVETVEKCLAGAPKITNITFDPRDSKTIWVGVEIDGVYRSQDGGESWERLPDLGDSVLNQDVHGLTISNGPEPKVLVSTPDGVWSSPDEGQHWALHGFPRFYEKDQISYCRGGGRQSRRPGHDLRRQRRFCARQDWRHSALDRWREKLAGGQPAGDPELDHLLVWHPSGRPRHRRGQQPARLCVYQHRRGRLVGKGRA